MLSEDFLKGCFWELKRDKASGIDGVKFEKYEASLAENFKELVVRMKAWKYGTVAKLPKLAKSDEGSHRENLLETAKNGISQLSQYL